MIYKHPPSSYLCSTGETSYDYKHKVYYSINYVLEHLFRYIEFSSQKYNNIVYIRCKGIKFKNVNEISKYFFISLLMCYISVIGIFYIMVKSTRSTCSSQEVISMRTCSKNLQVSVFFIKLTLLNLKNLVVLQSPFTI